MTKQVHDEGPGRSFERPGRLFLGAIGGHPCPESSRFLGILARPTLHAVVEPSVPQRLLADRRRLETSGLAVRVDL